MKKKLKWEGKNEEEKNREKRCNKFSLYLGRIAIIFEKRARRKNLKFVEKYIICPHSFFHLIVVSEMKHFFKATVPLHSNRTSQYLVIWYT